MTLVDESAATDWRKPPPAEPFGVGIMFQLDPFQCSASVMLVSQPTAQMSFAETAATPTSQLLPGSPLFGPGMLPFGLETMLQALPLQRSVSVWYLMVALSKYAPTAHTSLAETAATP